MSTTRALVNAPTGTLTSATIPVLDFASLVEVPCPQPSNGASTMYVLASGDEDRPTYVRVSVYDNPKANAGKGERKVTIKVSFTATEIDDTSGEYLIDDPASVSITTVTPGQSPIFDVDDHLAYVFGAVSMLYQTLDTNVPDTGVVDKLKYGITAIV